MVKIFAEFFNIVLYVVECCEILHTYNWRRYFILYAVSAVVHLWASSSASYLVL
jgi:hypothetical protein